MLATDTKVTAPSDEGPGKLIDYRAPPGALSTKLVGALFIALVLWIAFEITDRRALTSSDNLLITNNSNSFPTMITATSDKIDWQKSILSGIGGENTGFHAGAEEINAVVWTNGGSTEGVPQLSQTILQYGFATQATVQFLQVAPARAYAQQLEQGLGLSNPEPATIPFHSRVADQERTLCAIGTVAGCKVWYYWARYGQYIVQLRLLDIRPISAHTFAAYVQLADERIVSQLGR